MGPEDEDDTDPDDAAPEPRLIPSLVPPQRRRGPAPPPRESFPSWPGDDPEIIDHLMILPFR